METNENQMKWLTNSISVKVTIIGAIILVLLLPTNLINHLMQEREKRLKESTNEISSKWGKDQKFGALVLSIPCLTRTVVDNKLITKNRVLNILPDELNIEGELVPVELYRGMFKSIVYKADLKISGSFDRISNELVEDENNFIDWKKACLSIGISDSKGINQIVAINWNGKALNTSPGVGINPVLMNGVHKNVLFDPEKANHFEINLDVNGSGMCSFLPLGKVTKVELASPWQHPQFDGAYLPDVREVNKGGFKASWTVLEHNRNFPQQWFDDIKFRNADFGVQLIEPVNIYQKSQRSVKYAILFIVLTFLVFFFSELIIHKKAHPIQYIMVGAALCLFFSLLIALSEHIQFNLAYLISSISIITMITLFSRSVFNNNRVSSVVFFVLTVLFTFLFVILQLSDISLLIGNIGLVIILSIVMTISRKIDWYHSNNK